MFDTRRLSMAIGRGIILPVLLVALIGANSLSAQQRAETRGNQSHAVIAGGNVTIGVSQETLDAIVQEFRESKKTLQDLTAFQKDTIDLFKEKLDLNQRQIRAALDILGETNVAPERLAAKLIEIA
jgi:hypothetical protein